MESSLRGGVKVKNKVKKSVRKNLGEFIGRVAWENNLGEWTGILA